jgi:hypothetical protein
MKRTKELAGSNLSFEIDYYSIGWIVTININGQLWDHREYGEDQAAAEAFFADPTAADRKQAERMEALQRKREEDSIPYYAADFVRVSRGRRVGAKPTAA